MMAHYPSHMVGYGRHSVAGAACKDAAPDERPAYGKRRSPVKWAIAGRV